MQEICKIENETINTLNKYTEKTDYSEDLRELTRFRKARTFDSNV